MMRPVNSTPSSSWSARLWSDAESTVAAIFDHPFVTGLNDGTLDGAAFEHYIVQDVLYLRDYARALAVVGAKAPTLAATAMLARHAADTSAVELALHGSLVRDMGLDPADVDRATVQPTTRAYVSYLLAAAYGGSFAEGLAAVLPCYWIYAEVGARLAKRSSPNPRYQRWIDSYGGEEFASTVREVLALTDEIGPTLSVADEVAARAHFVTTARYEWMFFDAAHRREAWPI